VDFIAGDNEYRSTAESLDRYFLPFAVAARNRHAVLAGHDRAVRDAEEG